MPTDITTPDAVLRVAADLLDTNPRLWGRDYWLDPATGCRCSGGLIAYVIAPDNADADPYRLPAGEQLGLAIATIELFEQHVEDELFDRFGPDGVRDASEPLIGLWNDRVCRDAAHAAQTMRAAADAAVVSA